MKKEEGRRKREGVREEKEGIYISTRVSVLRL